MGFLTGQRGDAIVKTERRVRRVFPKRILTFLLALLLFAAIPAGIWATGPYQPPTLTVVVLGAPKDTEMRVIIQHEGEAVNVPLERETRAWENTYRLYRAAVWQFGNWYGNAYDFKGAELLLINASGQKRIPIPDGLLHDRGFNEIITLRYASGRLSYGLPAWRAPLLIGIRVLAALLIEGVIFFLSGYTNKKSWLLFLAINLVIHGALSIFCSSWINVNPSMYAVYFLCVFISFLLEITAFLLLVDEQSSDRAIGYLVKANLASHALNLLLIAFLPL